MLFHLMLLLCKTSVVNDPSEELRIDSIDVFDPAYQEFLDFKYGIVPENAFWKDIFSLVVILCAVLWIIYQMVLAYRQNRETTRILQSFTASHTKIQMISSFYDDTENLFSVLELQAKNVNDQYKNIDKRISQIQDFNKPKDWIMGMKDSWNEEYAFVGWFGDVFEGPVSDVRVKAEMTMAKGLVDKKINAIGEHLMEDKLQLEDVRRDVRMLKTYYGK